MAAGYQDIFLNQGETFLTTVTLDDDYGNPYNLTYFNVAGQAKTSYYTANTAITFNSSVYDANNGIIQLQLDANTTSNIAPGNYVYDVFIQQANTAIVTKVLEGRIFVNPGVTNISNISFE